MTARSERDPKPVSAVLAGFVSTPGWRERLAGGRLRARWPEVVGQQIAAHSEPARLAGGVLLVRAEAGPWATELALLSGRIASLADEYLGGGAVREVKVVAAGGPQRRRQG